MLKRLPTVQETQVRSLGREDPLEEMATHSNILAWKIPWTEDPGRLQSMGSQRVGHDWVTSLHFKENHYLQRFQPIFISILSSSTFHKPSGKILCRQAKDHVSHPFSSPSPPPSFFGSQYLTGKEIETWRQGNGVSPFYAHFVKLCSPTFASLFSKKYYFHILEILLTAYLKLN